MYSSQVCLCVPVCLSLATFPQYCRDPGVRWGNGSGCPLVVHYWPNLQSVHGFHCYDNIAPNAKYQRVLVVALCVFLCVSVTSSTKLTKFGSRYLILWFSKREKIWRFVKGALDVHSGKIWELWLRGSPWGAKILKGVKSIL